MKAGNERPRGGRLEPAFRQSGASNPAMKSLNLEADDEHGTWACVAVQQEAQQARILRVLSTRQCVEGFTFGTTIQYSSFCLLSFNMTFRFDRLGL